MTPKPTGTVTRTELIITRAFRAPIDDGWASITESDRTARWYGPWTSTDQPPRPGSTVSVQLLFEEGQPWGDARIEACVPPTSLHLALLAGPSEEDMWHVALDLVESSGSTRLTLTQQLGPGIDPADIGPGWEYYLDMLVAARNGMPLPDFADYYPLMSEHYSAK
ncbi:SRPBCC domain-containing protein [Hoyosella sp. G463]|uniref:SRPBCC domain-containing protein n=1 Tax=Lolliginicoccus lacisalsi TaxID=2742202 RepID=A0A927JE88_9ACTN|nr:SRPBCC domain-containing protein [Lolliginicoccus lacisalsi]MBD8507580.1 SRPBCC domain-containing protein [Lolliginicoccus lacisalsi]